MGGEHKMKTYIINLKKAELRRRYMQQQLTLLPSSLRVEYVEAVDGRAMSPAEQDKQFDAERFRAKYAKEVRPGEIGCTLSHQKCYGKLLDSREKYALILEDDIVVRQNIDMLLPKIEKLVDADEPRVLLLSGWYWYLDTKVLGERHRLVTVYDAFLTHAYVINREAASLLIEPRPFITADDWYYIRKKGVKIYAVLPHLIDQEWSGELPTSINLSAKQYCKGMWRRKMGIRIHSLLLKILYYLKRYEQA